MRVGHHDRPVAVELVPDDIPLEGSDAGQWPRQRHLSGERPELAARSDLCCGRHTPRISHDANDRILDP